MELQKSPPSQTSIPTVICKPHLHHKAHTALRVGQVPNAAFARKKKHQEIICAQKVATFPQKSRTATGARTPSRRSVSNSGTNTVEPSFVQFLPGPDEVVADTGRRTSLSPEEISSTLSNSGRSLSMAAVWSSPSKMVAPSSNNTSNFAAASCFSVANDAPSGTLSTLGCLPGPASLI
mmetsp:Transcript_31636/g.93200  ORF Transcript_31636/g.93200 Transcript_31636/m.93200 type:complete len:178 (-) Transcript_31636:351-884(-)